MFNRTHSSKRKKVDSGWEEVAEDFLDHQTEITNQLLAAATQQDDPVLKWNLIQQAKLRLRAVCRLLDLPEPE